MGNACGALSTQALGGTKGFPQPAEVERFLAGPDHNVAPNYSTSNSSAVCHFPFVKSGNATGTLPPATDFSDSGEIALLVTES